MKAASVALSGFASQTRSPVPYEVDLGFFKLRGGVCTVRLVRCKSGLAAARKVMLGHAVAGVASVMLDGKITYGAQWLCNGAGGSVDAVILPVGTDVPMCKICTARLSGPGVYRVFDAASSLIYIGSAEHVDQRVAKQRAHADWKDRIAGVQITPFSTVAQARVAEVRAIFAERPLLNVLHAKAGAA